MIYKLQHRWKFFIIEGRPIGSNAIVKGMTNDVYCFRMCFFTIDKQIVGHSGYGLCGVTLDQVGSHLNLWFISIRIYQLSTKR